MSAAATLTAPTSASAGASVVKEARYVLANIAANNNKFWNIRLFGDSSCETHWGRVGEDGQKKWAATFSEPSFDSKCREKENKGYKLQKTLNNSIGGGNTNNDKLAEAAVSQIGANSPETLKLVAYLARVNIHRILQATTMEYDTSRGTFSTPLGIVTKAAILKARQLLGEIAGLVKADSWDTVPTALQTLNDYLMLIPQNIGRSKPDPRKLFAGVEAVEKQSGILDALEASLQMVLSAPDAQAEPPTPKMFEAQLHLVTDETELARIRTKYQKSRQDIHVCAHLEVKRVFRVEISGMKTTWEQKGRKIGNVQEFWHGTRASNLLSILKSGFVIAPANATHCTGRMFGNGAYFSDQSTKSLNYAYGYWGSGRGRDENCFMFMCDVAMGKSHTPKSWSETFPKAGYDSTFAKSGVSGVGNNEMIVYDTCQVNPTFLVEFGPKDK